jgi:hypothetical protein
MNLIEKITDTNKETENILLLKLLFVYIFVCIIQF